MLRVCVDKTGKFGDPTPVIVDEGNKITDAERQALAIRLGAPETVFINSIADAHISIIHTQGEVDFAGVPALGAAWLLTKLHQKPITSMQSRAGKITVSQEGEITWVRADLATMPPWHHRRLESTAEVEGLTLDDTKSWEHTMIWAWTDEANGRIRARTFATDWDIPEAEGNGSGSMMLAAMLGKSLEITHGNGSVIFARPAPSNCAELGGRIVEAPSVSLQST